MMYKVKQLLYIAIDIYYPYLLPLFVLGTGFLIEGTAPNSHHVIFLIPIANWFFIIMGLLIAEDRGLIFTLLVLWGIVGIGFIHIKKMAIREQYQQKKETARIKHHTKEQDGYQKQLIVLGDNSMTLFEQMPELLKAAEEYLNQAEFEFSEGAFAPFWDAIEKTAKKLGYFDEGVQSIRNNSSRYTDLITKCESVPPQFPLARRSVDKLSVGTSTAERMKEIVRTAQRNFQFATIYEQRKTNQILVAGFTNLAQALDRMTWQITDSIDSLAGSVDSMASTLNESLNTIHSRLGDMAEANIAYNSEVAKSESDRVVREKKAIEMLDNIQYHRKPTIL